jgi:hypothetical protein
MHARIYSLKVVSLILLAIALLTNTAFPQNIERRTIQSVGEIKYNIRATNLASGQENWEPKPYGLTYCVFENDGSIRLDPTTETDDRATWLIRRYSVKAGQVVCARALIKTGILPTDYVPPEPWSNGARIGIDFWAGGKVVRSIELTGIDGYGPWIGGGWVPWGSDWTFRELYIPYISASGKDTVIREGEEEVIMWLQAMAHDAPASAWFKNTEFYILNAGEVPPPPLSG